jgi:hypothetical protein
MCHTYIRDRTRLSASDCLLPYYLKLHCTEIIQQDCHVTSFPVGEWFLCLFR